MPNQNTFRFKLRAQDVLLALMLGALTWLTHDAWQMSFMGGLAILQLIEGRVPWLDTTWGRITSVVVQLIIGYLLVGLTGGVQSPYYLVLLLPVVTTASYLGVAGTLLSTLVATGAYLSFLLFIDWRDFFMDAESEHILVIRCLLPAVAAVLVNSLGEAIRVQSARYKATAEQLAEAEASVRRSDRLAALGQLSAGLAHELRNPLGSIKGSAELLTRSAEANEMTRELAGIINAEVDRTNSLVTRFLDFARPLHPRLETANLHHVIDQAAERAKVNIVRHYEGPQQMQLDPELMHQVFLNLITNASQAGSPDAPVTVQTQAAAGFAVIDIIDSGCGIPPEALDSVFNPFFTTKHEGTGLGLAIVAKIIDGHGGKIKVESEPGKGSKFSVFLPLHS